MSSRAPLEHEIHGQKVFFQKFFLNFTSFRGSQIVRIAEWRGSHVDDQVVLEENGRRMKEEAERIQCETRLPFWILSSRWASWIQKFVIKWHQLPFLATPKFSNGESPSISLPLIRFSPRILLPTRLRQSLDFSPSALRWSELDASLIDRVPFQRSSRSFSSFQSFAMAEGTHGDG